jgi:hypothetical protein
VMCASTFIGAFYQTKFPVQNVFSATSGPAAGLWFRLATSRERSRFRVQA